MCCISCEILLVCVCVCHRKQLLKHSPGMDCCVSKQNNKQTTTQKPTKHTRPLSRFRILRFNMCAYVHMCHRQIAHVCLGCHIVSYKVFVNCSQIELTCVCARVCVSVCV